VQGDSTPARRRAPLPPAVRRRHMLGAMRLRTMADLRGWIAADLERYELGTGAGLLLGLLRLPQARWTVRLRVTEFVVNRPRAAWAPLRALLRWRLQRQAIRLGFTIPVNVVGPGLKLPHWGTIVISADARVGARCTIHPGTSLGLHHGRAPTLGDDVYVAPGAKLFGAITIGHGASIGANAVVTSDVAPAERVGGVPARPLPARRER
jgi:serine O-acetyltransferase